MKRLESVIFTNSYDAVESIEKFGFKNICVTDGSITKFHPQYVLRLEDIEGDDLDFMKIERASKTYKVSTNENYVSVFEIDAEENESFEIARIYESWDRIHQLYGGIDNYLDL